MQISVPLREFIKKRLLRLESDIAPLEQYIENHPLEYKNKQRLVETNTYFQQAKESFGSQNIDSLNSWRKQVYKAIIHAQVEMDTIYNPEVDPIVGWVKQELIDLDKDNKKFLQLDTQLMTLHFDLEKSGSVINFEYKPRKANLVNFFEELPESYFAIDYLFEGELEKISLENQNKITLNKIDYLNTKHSLDLCGFRFISEIAEEVKLIKHYSFKAGIGAYLPNSTTGFSIEYWLESAKELKDNLYLVNQFSLLFPSGSELGLTIKGLGSFGGIGENSFEASKSQLLNSGSVAGGLYGLRMIDGVTNLTIDIRFSKAISAIQILPVHDQENNLVTMQLKVFVKAKNVINDDKAMMVFLSII